MAEGVMLQRLSHPNVVEGYDIQLEPYPRIVMEYLDGMSLKTAFFEGNYGAFEVEDAVDVTLQIADALTYVHEQGLLHLDVKPSNVMYNDGHATLFDFSVAEEYSPDEPLKDNAGTVQYMAPEQTHRREVGYATDVFGLGVVFFQMLTGGELPYSVVRRPLATDDEETDAEEDTDPEDKRQLDYDVPLKAPSTFNPRVSRRVDEIAIKALQTNMSDRYASPREFADALEDAL